MKTREIKTFELTVDYYKQSFINGNISHVKQELSELFYNTPSIAVKLIFELPIDIQTKVINSDQFQTASKFLKRTF